jgi:hypothetical protein
MPILGTIASSKLSAVGDFESIATVSVGSGGAASAAFTSIPATFTHLQIRSTARADNADPNNGFKIQFNSDTGSNYARHEIYSNGSTLAAEGSASIAYAYADYAATGATAASLLFGVSIIDILDYSNTNKQKTLKALSGNDRAGSGNLAIGSSLWVDTDAITSILIEPLSSANWVEHSHFALYGIKGA